MTQLSGDLSLAARTTGRMLVLLAEDGVEAGVAQIQQLIGKRLVSTASTEGGIVSAADLQQADGIIFDKLGIVVCNANSTYVHELRAMASSDDHPILAVEPERVVYAVREPVFSGGTSTGSVLRSVAEDDYLRGFLEGATSLARSLLQVTNLSESAVTSAVAIDEKQATWGLQATNVLAERYSGRGVNVAVLDTGCDIKHPDFAGRSISGQSFISGEDIQDGFGHGTHCVGISCGSQQPEILPRYGVAYDANIFVGKVLSNFGNGTDGGILAGMNWAISHGCRVISMSLGSPVYVGQAFSVVFESAAQRALAAGTVMIAAAGNFSSRKTGVTKPVIHPANCPSIMAVAAVDSELRVADFSCQGISPEGGQIDIAGPGVDIYASLPMPTRYGMLSGTSMATPYVAGIAALHAQANPDVSAERLWNILTQTASRSPLPSMDVGAGLVQAP
jgi:subtilisin family serine protease